MVLTKVALLKIDYITQPKRINVLTKIFTKASGNEQVPVSAGISFPSYEASRFELDAEKSPQCYHPQSL